MLKSNTPYLITADQLTALNSSLSGVFFHKTNEDGTIEVRIGMIHRYRSQFEEIMGDAEEVIYE